MTDIVERLRQSVTKGHEPTDDLAIEAADEIGRSRKEAALWKSRVDEACAVLERRELAFDRMQDEIERLREALRMLQIAVDREGWPAGWGQIRTLVRSTLSEPPQ